MTKMYDRGVNQFPRIIEAPVFGHDNNHIGLQISDWLISGLICPMVGQTYLSELFPENVHCHPRYKLLKDTFKDKLKSLLFTYRSSSERCKGIYLSNPLSDKSSSEIFE